MHVETNRASAADALRSELDCLILRLKSNASRVLYERDPDSAEGLNVAAINDHAHQCGLVPAHRDIMKIEQQSKIRHHTLLAKVYHPDLDDPIEWTLVPFMADDGRSLVTAVGDSRQLAMDRQNAAGGEKLNRTVEHLLAWKSRLTSRSPEKEDADAQAGRTDSSSESLYFFARLPDGRYQVRFNDESDTFAKLEGLRLVEFLLKQPDRKATLRGVNKALCNSERQTGQQEYNETDQARPKTSAGTRRIQDTNQVVQSEVDDLRMQAA